MNINIGQREGKVGGGRTVIGQLTRQSEMLDAQGNVIDPRTKQIIKKAEL